MKFLLLILALSVVLETGATGPAPVSWISLFPHL